MNRCALSKKDTRAHEKATHSAVDALSRVGTYWYRLVRWTRNHFHTAPWLQSTGVRILRHTLPVFCSHAGTSPLRSVGWHHWVSLEASRLLHLRGGEEVCTTTNRSKRKNRTQQIIQTRPTVGGTPLPTMPEYLNSLMGGEYCCHGN